MTRNAPGGKRIFTTAAGIKPRRVNGRYQCQPPSFKFTCICTLDQHFPHPRDSRLYSNVQAFLDNLLDEVEWRANWQELEGSTTQAYSRIQLWNGDRILIIVIFIDRSPTCHSRPLRMLGWGAFR